MLPGSCPPPGQDISNWIERFSLMAVIVDHVQDCHQVSRDVPGPSWLFAPVFLRKCQSYGLIKPPSFRRSATTYGGKRLVTYDCQFCWQALDKKDLNWSVTDPPLYSEAFTGPAQSIARCSFCLQDDHLAAYCLHNSHHLYLGWFPELLAWPAFLPPNHPTPSRPSTQEICCCFNHR